MKRISFPPLLLFVAGCAFLDRIEPPPPPTEIRLPIPAELAEAEQAALDITLTVIAIAMDLADIDGEISVVSGAERDEVVIRLPSDFLDKDDAGGIQGLIDNIRDILE